MDVMLKVYGSYGEVVNYASRSDGEYPRLGVLGGLLFAGYGAAEIHRAIRVWRRFGWNPPEPEDWVLRETGFGLGRRNPAAGIAVGIIFTAIGSVVALASLLRAATII
ncbi:hypothetical protein [Micromonospora pattaloongensis]|uniref:hypothetical protein n=1 Tax=Micromonospora pattaloongensis TaxID=405436 RepID=UPI00111517A7|nr:hypothetical protein [Micromonospora pattaloongensis]